MIEQNPLTGCYDCEVMIPIQYKDKVSEITKYLSDNRMHDICRWSQKTATRRLEFSHGSLLSYVTIIYISFKDIEHLHLFKLQFPL